MVMLVLCLILMLFVGAETLLAEGLSFGYDEAWICKGESFDVRKFEESQVLVPLTVELLGWGLSSPSVTPLADTVLWLSYVDKSESDVVRSKPFYLHVRDHPQLWTERREQLFCEGETIHPPKIRAENCDEVYWKCLQNSLLYFPSEDLGIAMGDSLNFLLVATNEQCTEMVSLPFTAHVFRPDQFRMSVASFSGDLSLCGDSLSLEHKLANREVQVFYKGEYQSPYGGEGVVPYRVVSNDISWMREDACVTGRCWVDGEYQNSYHLAVCVEESLCHTRICVDEWRDVYSHCEALESVSHTSSYECLANKGVGRFYFGADLPLVDVRFVAPDFMRAAIFSPSDVGDAATLRHPYRGSADFCWTAEVDNDWEAVVELTCLAPDGSSLAFVDTVEVSRCAALPLWMESACLSQEGVVTLYVGSVSPICGFSVSSPDGMPMALSSRRSFGRVPSLYTSSWECRFEVDDVSRDTFDCDFMVFTMECGGDTVRESHRLSLPVCEPRQRLYYGAYSSPKAILLNRDECLKHQCCSRSASPPDTVRFSSDCPKDTVYLKLKLSEGGNATSRLLTVLSDVQASLSAPFAQTDLRNALSVALSGRGVTLSLSAASSCRVWGEFGGLPFAFAIEKPDGVVEAETVICEGESLDLNSLIRTANADLRWNVADPVVLPSADSKYYLYGVSAVGCVVDDTVTVRVGARVLFDCKDTVVCDSVPLSWRSCIWTSASELALYEDDVPILSDTFVPDESVSYWFVATSDCERRRIPWHLSVVSCDTVTANEDEKIPENVLDEDVVDFLYTEYFSPNGDGQSDFWRAEWSGNAVLFIYDRMGKLLYETAESPVRWNGKYQNHPMPSGDYWFLLCRNGNAIQAGHFTLVR